MFFVKFDALFVLKYAKKKLIEKVLPTITHYSAKFRNVFSRFQVHVFHTITSNSRRRETSDRSVNGCFYINQ